MSEEKETGAFSRKAYAAAEKALRAAHAEEFDALLSAEYEKAGVKRRVRLSAEEREARRIAERALKEAAKEALRREKALAAAQALAAEFPDLVQVAAPVAEDDSAA